MKRIITVCFLVALSMSAFAQPRLNPVKWTFEAVKKSDKQYDIVFTANVDAPWHIYSQFVKKGPVPTSIIFKKNVLVQIKGVAREIGKLEKHFDKNFGAEIAYFSNKVQFVQTINLRAASKTSVSGEIEYMAVSYTHLTLPTKRIV